MQINDTYQYLKAVSSTASAAKTSNSLPSIMFNKLTRANTRFLHCHYVKSFSSSPLSTCIVGSGPSGFYTAKYLLKKVKDIQISIVDELPTPFGLVRYGVAPDHADTKNVINV